MTAVFDRAAARPWLVLCAWSAALALARYGSTVGVSWHSFVQGTRILFSTSALHLFAQHSALQIGPATYLVLAPIVLTMSGLIARWIAMTLLMALGLIVLALIRPWLGPPDRRTRRRFLITSLALSTSWSQLAITYTHADDALALVLGTAAVRLSLSRRPVAAAVALGLAADCKPWALAFAPLLLVLHGRDRWVALIAWAATVAAAWLPFVVADPRSAAAAGFRIANVATSSLRALGVEDARTPLWDRPAQIALGAALAFVAVRRGRWWAVLVLAVCARLLLDPSTKTYYDAGLAVGAAIVDTAALAGTLPVASISVLLVFMLPRALLGEHPALYGLVRTLYLVVTVTAALTWPVGRPGAGSWLVRVPIGGDRLLAGSAERRRPWPGRGAAPVLDQGPVPIRTRLRHRRRPRD